MSIGSRLKKAVKRVAKATVTRPAKFVGRQFTKEGFRKQLGVMTKVGKVAIPVVAAGVTFFAGPAAGEAFAYAGTRLQQQTARASMRGKHMDSHEISQKARAIANRTFKYSQVGVGAGAAASAAVAIAGGSSVLSTVGQTLAGQSGSKLLGIQGGGPAINPSGGPPLTSGENPWAGRTMGSDYGIYPGSPTIINDPGELDPYTGMAASSTPTYSSQTAYDRAIRGFDSPDTKVNLHNDPSFLSQLGQTALGATGAALKNSDLIRHGMSAGQRNLYDQALNAIPGELGDQARAALGGGADDSKGGDNSTILLVGAGILGAVLLARAA